MGDHDKFTRIHDNWRERAAMARMAWTGFQPRHGRTGIKRRRGQGKGASRKGA